MSIGHGKRTDGASETPLGPVSEDARDARIRELEARVAALAEAELRLRASDERYHALLVEKESLRTSEQQLSSIVESIVDGCFTLDGELRFVYINDAALSRLGRPRAMYVSARR